MIMKRERRYDLTVCEGMNMKRERRSPTKIAHTHTLRHKYRQTDRQTDGQMFNIGITGAEETNTRTRD